jgi:hypothetical protein
MSRFVTQIGLPVVALATVALAIVSVAVSRPSMAKTDVKKRATCCCGENCNCPEWCDCDGQSCTNCACANCTCAGCQCEGPASKAPEPVRANSCRCVPTTAGRLETIALMPCHSGISEPLDT